MTVSTTPGRVQYVSTGVIEPYPIPFKFQNAGDLRVFIQLGAEEVGTLQALSSHYTVTGMGQPSGGALTAIEAFPAGSIITIIRWPTFEQTRQYPASGKFPAESHEGALDKLTMLAERNNGRINRAIRVPDWEEAVEVTDRLSVRKNRFSFWNEAGGLGVADGDVLFELIGTEAQNVVDSRIASLVTDLKFVDSFLPDDLAATDLQRWNAAIAAFNAGEIGGIRLRARDYIIDGPLNPITRSNGAIIGVGRKSRMVLPVGVPYFEGIGRFFTIGTLTESVSDFTIERLSFIYERTMNDVENPNNDIWPIWHRRTVRCECHRLYIQNGAGLIMLGGTTVDERAALTTINHWRGDLKQGVNTNGNIRIRKGSSLSVMQVHTPGGTKGVAATNPDAATIKIETALDQGFDTGAFYNCAMQIFGKPYGVYVDRNSAPVTNVRFLYCNFDHTITKALYWDSSQNAGIEDPGDPDDDGAKIFTRMFQWIGNRTSTDSGGGLYFNFTNGKVVSGFSINDNVVQMKQDFPGLEVVCNPNQTINFSVDGNDWMESVAGITKTIAVKMSGSGWTYTNNRAGKQTQSSPPTWATHLQITDATSNDIVVSGNQQPEATIPIVVPVWSSYPDNRNISIGSSPSIAEMGIVVAPKDGTDQAAALAADLARWQAVSATASETSNAPNPLARPLTFLAGDYRHLTGMLIETCGVENVVQSDGADSRQRGISYLMKHSRSEFKNLSVSGAPVGTLDKIGFKITGDLRRNGYMLRCVSSDRDVGHWYEGTGAFDTIIAPMSFRGRKGFHISGNNFDIINPTAVGITGAWGMEFSSAQGVRSINAHNGGNTFLRGSSANVLIENYFTQASLTGGKKRTCGIITGVANVGGYPELTIVTKVSATVAASGPIFQGGDEDNRAEARIVFTGTAGSVSSILAGATELLAAPVSYVTSASATATAIVAAINANTGTHGYTAIARSNAVIIWAPLGANFTANGRSIAATTAGGLTAAFNSFVRFNWASAHGFSDIEPVPQFFRFDTAPHAGDHVVAAVVNTTDVIVEVSDATTGTVGLAWVPHMLIPEEGGATLANTGGAYDRAVGLRSPVTDTTITLNIPFADLPALPALSRVEAPGWDVWVHALDTNTLRANDQFFHGGNINYLLILGAFNCFWNRTRLKRRVHVLDRANVQMRSEAMQFYRQGRGRASADADQVPAVSGARTGWWVEEYNPGADQGLGYYVHMSPNKNLPPIDLKPQTNEFRQYEDRWEYLIGSAVKLTIDTDAIKPAAPMRLASYTIANKPSAVTAGAGALIWVTDAAPANDKRAYSDGTVWRDSAGTTI